MRALFTFLPKEEQQLSLINRFPQVEFVFQKGLNERDIVNAEIIVTYGEDLQASHIEAAKELKWVMVASAGLEKMPLQEIENRNILLTNVRGIHKIPMAESVLAHILSIKKSLPIIAENQKNAVWSKRVPSTELYGSTALIMGPGAIGGEVGRLLQAFGVRTIGCNRSGKTAPYMDEMVSISSLKEALPKADIVVSILPSTKETRGLFTYNHFQAMKSSAIFMNYGRGDLVQEEDLMKALNDNCIAYAVLDVFEQEPLESGHPLWNMSNVIISPHISSHSSQYVVRALEIFSRNLSAYLNHGNDFENVIDASKGY